MKRIFLLLSVLFFSGAEGQNFTIIDSLKRELIKFEKSKSEISSSPADSVKASLLYQMSREYWSGNLDTAMILAEEVLNLSEKINYKTGIGNAFSSMGVVYWYKGDYENALLYNQKALKTRLETGNKKEIANSYHNTGLVYDDQGNFTEALKNYLSALKINEEINSKEGIALEHNVIGIINFNQKNYKEAIKHYLYALKLRKETGDKYDLTESYSNLGVVYFETGDITNCLINYSAALNLRQEIGDQQGIAISYNNFGDVYLKQKNYAEALKSYNQALEINNKIGYRKSVADVYMSIGNVYLQKGDLTEAISKTHQSIEISKELGAVDYLVRGYQQLATMYAESKDYKKAFEYEQLFKQANDSIFNSDKTKELARQQIQYEYDKKHFADSLQFAQQQEFNDLKLQRQRIVSRGGIAGLIIVITLLFFIYKNYVKQKIANKNLRETQEQLIHQEKLASLGQMTVGIAHEIQNPLNFVNNFSDVSIALMDEIQSEKDERLRNEALSELKLNIDRINKHGKRADSIVRGMLLHGRTGQLEKENTDINFICEESLGVAFASVKLQNPEFECDVEKNFDANIPRIKIVRQEISRVLLNLLNNAFYELSEKQLNNRKPKIVITTHLNPHKDVKISISDNANGIPLSVRDKIFQPFFTTKPTGIGTGLGLSISYDIIKAHGGEITLKSEEGKGTVFEIILPLT